jgi:hypothetical protein
VFQCGEDQVAHNFPPFSGGECRNLSLGLVTKPRACKVVGQEGSPGVKESVKE